MSESVKVCHITSVHGPHDIRIFYKECVSLAKAGFITYLIATNCNSEKKDGVEIIGVNVNYKTRLGRMCNSVNAVLLQALSTNSDIYHIHDPELLRISGKLLKLNKKVIYDSHEDLPRQILGKHWIPKPFRRILASVSEFVENRYVRKVTAVIAATPHIACRFSKINKFTFVINNFPFTGKEPSAPYDNTYREICYIGSISAERGISTLLDSLDICNVTLNLAGNYSPVSYRNTLSQHRNWNKVKEWGFVPPPKTGSILSRSGIGIVTLKPTPAYIHSQPIKLFEYMLSGLPVVASGFPLWKKIVEENNCGICVDPLNPEEIAHAVNYILENPELAKTMGRNGRKAVLYKYNWQSEEKKLIEVYKNLSDKDE